MEPNIAEAADGSLFMVLRTQLGSVFCSRSTDGGVTWTKPQTTGLIAPESMPQVSRVPGSDKILVVWNHSEYDPSAGHYGKRTPLTVAVTEDCGKTFTNFWNILTDPEASFSNFKINWTSSGYCLLSYPNYLDKDFKRSSANIIRFKIKD